jgi:DNA-directed RNA polymerase
MTTRPSCAPTASQDAPLSPDVALSFCPENRLQGIIPHTSQKHPQPPEELPLMTVTELDRQAQMKAAGVARFERRQDALQKAGAFADSAYGRTLLSDHLLPLADALKVTLEGYTGGKVGRPPKYLQVLSKLDENLLAYLTLSSTLSFLFGLRKKGQPHYHLVCRQIGQAVYDELNWRGLRENDTKAFYTAKNARTREWAYEATGIAPPTAAETTPIGALLLDHLFQLDLVEKVVSQVSPTNREAIVQLTQKTLDAVAAQRLKAGSGKFIGVLPIFRPMKERPLRWTNPWNGGYHRLRLPLVKSARIDYRAVDMPHVYQAVNAMQDVALAINVPTYNLVRKMWANGISIGKLPRGVQEPLPGRLPDEEWATLSESQRASRNALARSVREANRQAASDVAGIGQTLDIASELGTDPFWLPYQLDYRGRAYAVPLFNHQGPDWMRAMIDFAEGKPLGDRGATWLGITLAGLWDGPEKLSKAPYQDRYSWTEDNEELIRSIVADPLGDMRWAEADKPWLFLRTAMDWVGYLEQGEDFVSYLPLALDGSCSGVQHYSAMLRDQQGGAEVNLVPNDRPADVYGTVSADVLAIMAEMEDSIEKTWWLAHGVNRKVCKKPVMTYGYSSRVPGFTEWYQYEFVVPWIKKHGDPGIEPHKLARWLAKVTLQAVEARLTAVAGGMGWLQTCAKLVSKQDKGLDWVTPDGFPVRQEIRSCPSVRVDTALRGERIRVAIPGEPKGIDKAAMEQGIGPNFVHSMDAAHLRLCANALVGREVSSMLFIHDSFGVLAADMDTLYVTVRQTFVDMYEDTSPLDDLYQAVLLQLPEDQREKLPPPPQPGSLDLRAVHQCAYCFA